MRYTFLKQQHLKSSASQKPSSAWSIASQAFCFAEPPCGKSTFDAVKHARCSNKEYAVAANAFLWLLLESVFPAVCFLFPELVVSVLLGLRGAISQHRSMAFWRVPDVENNVLGCRWTLFGICSCNNRSNLNGEKLEASLERGCIRGSRVVV